MISYRDALITTLIVFEEEPWAVGEVYIPSVRVRSACGSSDPFLTIRWHLATMELLCTNSFVEAMYHAYCAFCCRQTIQSMYAL